MGIPFVKGRDFNEGDQHKSTPVIVVTETFVRQHFPNEDPIGKRIKPGISSYEGEKPTMREIVGVVGDVKNAGPEPRAKTDLLCSPNSGAFQSDDHRGQGTR